MQHYGKIIRTSHNDCGCQVYRKSAWCPSSTELGIGAVEGFQYFQRKDTGTFVGPCPNN